jgi:hypothetical protein
MYVDICKCAYYDAFRGFCVLWHRDAVEGWDEEIYAKAGEKWHPKVREYPEYCTACNSFKPRQGAA